MKEQAIDFSKIHPRTELWFRQKHTCLACDHCANREVKSGDASARVMRCKLTKGVGAAIHGYCIDARDTGQPCGPDARNFKRKD